MGKTLLIYLQISFMMAALSMAWIYLATYMSEKISGEDKWDYFYKPHNQLGMYIMCIVIWPIIISMAIFMAVVTIFSILRKL